MMTLYEKISIGMASGALLFSVFSLRKSHNSNKISKNALHESEKANNISMGSLESQINSEITLRQDKLLEILEKIEVLTSKNNLSKEEKKMLAFYEKTLLSTIQSFLNTYEEACGKYRDNKVDKVRFRKKHFTPIRELMESADTSAQINKPNSNYGAIKAVHKEWYDLENGDA
jgi:hypothetical protein